MVGCQRGGCVEAVRNVRSYAEHERKRKWGSKFDYVIPGYYIFIS
jgi:hypothetical protein